MKISDLAKRMEPFGLEPAEASLYYHLSRLGAARASELAQAAGLRRTEAYRLLEELVGKGAAQKTMERPAKFVAAPVEELLQRGLEAKEKEVRALDAERHEIAKAWPQVRAAEGLVGERFAIHAGRNQIHGVLGRLFRSAEEEVLIVSSRRAFVRVWDASLARTLEEARSRGVTVKVLTETHEADPGLLEQIRRCGPVRHLDLPGYYQVVLVDTKQVVLLTSPGAPASTGDVEETALWIHAADVAIGQRFVFDHLWMMGVDAGGPSQPGDGLDVRPPVSLLRGRWIRLDQMRELAFRAHKQIRLTVPTGELERLRRSGVWGALERRGREGILVLVRSPEETPASGSVKHELTPGERAMPFVVMSIDDREALVALPADGEPESLVHEGDWAIVARLAPAVRLAAALS